VLKRILLCLAVLAGLAAPLQAAPKRGLTVRREVVVLSTGIKPSLSLNLAATGAFPASVTFTRASAATDVDVNGNIVSFSSGQARFGYDPVTHVALGYLSEDQRTNLLLNSLADGTSLSTQTVAVVNATSYVLTFYGTGSIQLSGASTALLSGTGAYPARVPLVFTSGTTSLTLTVTGSVKYAQLEATSVNYPGPTSFIPTAGSAATRVADVASMTGTNFSNWYNQPAGTFVVSATPPGNYNQNGAIFSAENSGVTIENLLARSAINLTGAGKRWVVAASSPAGTATPTSASDNLGTIDTVGYAYGLNDGALVVSGGVPVTSSSAGLPPTGSFTRLSIGLRGSPDLWCNCHVGWIKYYKTRLPNFKLQQKTGAGGTGFGLDLPRIPSNDNGAERMAA
jgi:hypothetical protein